MRRFSFLFVFSCCLLLFIGGKTMFAPCLNVVWSGDPGKEKKAEKSESPEEKKEVEEKTSIDGLYMHHSFDFCIPVDRTAICSSQSIHLPRSYYRLPKQPPQG